MNRLISSVMALVMTGSLFAMPVLAETSDSAEAAVYAAEQEITEVPKTYGEPVVYDGVGGIDIDGAEVFDVSDSLNAEAAEGETLNGTATLGVQKHSLDDVVAYLEALGSTRNEGVGFDTEPNTEAPYVSGVLQKKSKDDALITFNGIRYIAGLSPVTWNEAWDEGEMASALVNASNGGIDHFPVQPEGMDDTLYGQGYEYSGKSNLSAGFLNFYDSLVKAWMGDSDNANIAKLGHRRWCLNPPMSQVSFGAAVNSQSRYGNYHTMYVFDNADTPSSIENVAWPAQTMPVEYFASEDAWSLSVGKTVSETDTTVKLTRKSDGTVWNFSAGYSDGDFYVNNENYGMKGCIIFRPLGNLDYADGDSFSVEINTGEDVISYQVDFFSLDKRWHQHNYVFKSADLSQRWVASLLWTCKDCDYSDTGVVPTIRTVTKEPACEAEGIETIKAVDRNIMVLNDFPIPALGHLPGENGSLSDGVWQGECARCQKALERNVITDFKVYWGYSESDCIYEGLPDKASIGDICYFKIVNQVNGDGSNADLRYTLISSDETAVKATMETDQIGRLTIREARPVTLSLYPTLNPSIGIRRTLNVRDSWLGYYDIADTEISPEEMSYVYTGEAITPKMIVTGEEATLVEGKDYILSYDDNVNAGLMTVTITGIGHYSNSVTRTVTIESRSLEEATRVPMNVYHDGSDSPLSFDLKLEYNGTKLVKDKDYVIAASDYYGPGEVEITATGIGNFSGEVRADHIICNYETISGAKRYDTACDIARRAFPEGASEVILVTGAKFPDALSANAYAGAKNAPILLCKLTSLPDCVKNLLGITWGGQIKKVTIIGGGFEKKVFDDLVSCGIPRENIINEPFNGATRYQTAEKVCREGLKEGLFTYDTVIIATGASAADALSVSPWSYRLKWPILLAKRGQLNDSVKELADKFDHIILLGGNDVVSDDCAANGTERKPERLAGYNRYETSIRIADWFITNGYGSRNNTAFADGTDAHFPDALAGGMLQGQLGAPIILTSNNKKIILDYVTEKYSMKPETTQFFFLGAVGKGSGPCFNQLVKAIEAKGIR